MAEEARDLTLLNKYGMHARPALKFAEISMRYTSDIRVLTDEQEVNCKSVMGMMMLAAGQGTVLRVRANGDDAQAALAALEALVSSKFDEE